MNLYLGNSLMDYQRPGEWDKVTLVTLQMGCGQDVDCGAPQELLLSSPSLTSVQPSLTKFNLPRQLF